MKKIAIGVLIFAFLVAALAAYPQLNAKPATTEPEAVEDTQTQVDVEPVYETFAEGSSVNGIDISGKTPKEALKIVEDAFLSKEIRITYKDGQSSFSYRLLNCDFTDFEQYVTNNKPNESMVKLEYDFIEKIDFSTVDFLQALGNSEELTRSQNATLRVDVEKGTVEIVPEVIGNIPSEGVLEAKLTEAVKNDLPEITLTDGDYELPSVLSDDEKLASDMALIKKILNKKITLEVCGHTVTISSKKIRTMIEYDGEIKVKEDLVAEYVDDLKAKYDTCGVERAFTTSTGEKISIVKGTYGWTINRKSTIEKICRTILNEKKRPSINAVYSVKGQRPAGDEFQGTYIEVSIKNQHVWMYISGVCIVDDDCTTGEWNKESNHTREGMFFLKYKKRDVVLRGSDYADFVNYWMPYDKSIGLHDAGWRTDEEFGGTNYIGNGSHGCVNLRHDTAETIYNNWDADIPIIVW